MMTRNFSYSSINLSYSNIIPLKSYKKADTLKDKIMIDNDNQSGIYRWVNNINKNSYIGSAIDLKNRLVLS
jgi:hypothetical protein